MCLFSQPAPVVFFFPAVVLKRDGGAFGIIGLKKGVLGSQWVVHFLPGSQTCVFFSTCAKAVFFLGKLCIF
jgi:hypothetical protein